MSASATAPWRPCGEYPVALLDLPAAVKKELVAYRETRYNNGYDAMLAIDRAFAAADAARCRANPHFAAVLVAASECARCIPRDVQRALVWCNEALALLQGASSSSPLLRSVHCGALVARSQASLFTGKHTESLADAQQAAALAVTPWDEVLAYPVLVAMYNSMLDDTGRRLQREAVAKLDAAVAACEAGGFPSTDKVLQAGTEALWRMKYQTARSQRDYTTALVYVRKMRARAKHDVDDFRNDPIYMVGNEAETLVYLGRVEEAMALLVPAAQLLNSVTTVEDGITMMSSILSCVSACAEVGHSALAHSFLRSAEDIVKRERKEPKSRWAHNTIMMQEIDGVLARMKATMADLDGDAEGLAAHQRSMEELGRRMQRMCCSEGCTNRFQASGEKLFMCSACKKACYCSAACQKADWKARHKAECASKASKA